MRYAIILATLCACAEGTLSGNGVEDTEEVTDLPLGSFCLGEDPDSRICLDPADVSVAVSQSGEATHVRLLATRTIEYTDPVLGIVVEERALDLQGQVDSGLPLPQIAARVQLTYPSLGTCRSSRPINPFGGTCGRFDAPAICDAVAYDDPERAGLDLIILNDAVIAGRFTAALPFAMPQGACENDVQCTEAAAPEFTPDQAPPTRGLFHLVRP